MGRLRFGALLATLVAVLGGLATAGCGGAGGGSARADYARALNAAQVQLADRVGRLEAQVGATSTPEAEDRALAAYQAAVRAAMRRLRALRPPAGLAALHRRLVGDLAAYGRLIAVARADVRSGDPRRMLAAQGRLQSGVVDAGRALDATVRAIDRRLQR